MLDAIMGVASVINKLIEVHELGKWLKLFLGFAVTWFCAFSGMTGWRLQQGDPWSIAIGTGLLAGSGALLAVFRFSDKTKDIWVAFDKNIPVPPISDFQGEVKK